MERNEEALAKIYKALSWLFLPPSYISPRDYIEIKSVLEELRNAKAIPDDEIKTYLSKIIEYLDKIGTNSKEKNNIISEHTKLFINDFKRSSCPPYESIYAVRNQGKHKMIALPGIVERLRKIYEALGFEVSGLPGITEDHVSVELEFLSALHATLHNLTDQDLIEELERIRVKHVSYLIQWIPKFVDCIVNSAKEEYFKSLAGLLRKLIEYERLI